MSGFTYEDLRAALDKVAIEPPKPEPPVFFSRAMWAWRLDYFGEEPTGFRYVRPDGVLVDPLNPASTD